jgi:NTE family protein
MRVSWWPWRRESRIAEPAAPTLPPRIGLALGGGFARGIAHIGVLRVFERHAIALHAIAGVSSGSMVAAAYAAGADTASIETIARGMRFRDVARWTVSRTGLASSEPMVPFLQRLLPCTRFEQMRIPLAIVATDLIAGAPVVFRGPGDVILPIRASCSYPGLFQPVRSNGYCLVDGYIAREVPSEALTTMGVDRIIAVHLPAPATGVDRQNVFSIVHRCFQVMGRRLDHEWRPHADLVIEPDVARLAWDGFKDTDALIELGEQAASEALPEIERWLGSAVVRRHPASDSIAGRSDYGERSLPHLTNPTALSVRAGSLSSKFETSAFWRPFTSATP